MKKKNLVKIFSLSLCLTFVFSIVAGAKENKQYKSARITIYAVDPHPTEHEFPE